MATKRFTQDYKSRILFNTDYEIGHPNNNLYVKSLASWLMQRIKRAAKPYHEKHSGVLDNGKPGKIITITMEELEKKIKNTKELSPDGMKIYFGPTTLMSNPGRAIKLGLMTEDENQRKPSVDRIDSGILEYSSKNVQITTKKYNLGKSNSKSSDTINTSAKTQVGNNPLVKIQIGKINITLDNCSPQYLAAYTQSLAA